MFHVAIGPSNGEVCKTFALHHDGLAIFKNVCGPASVKIKKHFCIFFREHDLELTIQCNIKALNFVDVILNINRKKNIRLNPTCSANIVTKDRKNFFIFIR